jgi:hypothetical protein
MKFLSGMRVKQAFLLPCSMNFADKNGVVNHTFDKKETSRSKGFSF